MRCRAVVGGVVVLAVMAMALPARAGQDADAKELASYRLTKEGLDRYRQVLRALVGEMQKDPRFKEMATLQAEVDRLERKDDLTAAEEKRLDELQTRLEQLEETTTVSMTDGTLSEVEGQIRKNPPLSAALKAAGMAPRDYAKFTLVLFQASMAVGMQKAGLLKDLPKDIAADNVRFVEAHEQELEQLRRELESLAPSGREMHR